jgi:hypothetical protein
MISFGMKLTLFTFQDVYYEYDGDADPDDRGLTIDGYESAWLADLVGAYILDNTQQLFEESLFHGFYRDDSLAVFDSTYTYSRLAEWRSDFQSAVNNLAEGNYLQFSLSVWLFGTKRSLPLFQFDPQVTVVSTPTFPYLDIELLWKYDGSLYFQVHLKPNQQLKYLNRDITHTTACFKAIPHGVSTRLAKLTSILPSNKNKSLEQLYPKHYEKLRLANLLYQPTSTLSQEFERYKQSTTNQAKTTKLWRQRDRKRTVYFCIGYSRAWTTPIHAIIKDVKTILGLSWLRVSMSYHRFPNLQEYFQKDLQGKLLDNIQSLDFKTLPYNCRKEDPDHPCKYNAICRHSLIVYTVECRMR